MEHSLSPADFGRLTVTTYVIMYADLQPNNTKPNPNPITLNLADNCISTGNEFNDTGSRRSVCT